MCRTDHFRWWFLSCAADMKQHHSCWWKSDAFPARLRHGSHPVIFWQSSCCSYDHLTSQEMNKEHQIQILNSSVEKHASLLAAGVFRPSSPTLSAAGKCQSALSGEAAAGKGLLLLPCTTSYVDVPGWSVGSQNEASILQIHASWVLVQDADTRKFCLVCCFLMRLFLRYSVVFDSCFWKIFGNVYSFIKKKWHCFLMAKVFFS